MKTIIMAVTLNYFMQSGYMTQQEVGNLIANSIVKTTENGIQYFILK